jgi:hypothetical protein
MMISFLCLLMFVGQICSKLNVFYLSFILNATLHVNVTSKAFRSLMIYLYYTIVIIF